MDNQVTEAAPKALEDIALMPQYVALVRERSRFSWTLTAIMLVVYFGYIVVIAFDRALLSRSLAGGATTTGIPIGIGVIVIGVVLTGIYVFRANRRFDALEQTLRDEANA